MSNVVIIGRRLIPLDQIAFVEPFNPNSAPQIDSQRKFEARVMLLNREGCLTETPFETFAQQQHFMLLEADKIALNPAIHYRVEMFKPSEEFQPARAFQTRLLWEDHRGRSQSKLLVSSPGDVLAAVMCDDKRLSPPLKRSPTTVPNRRRRMGSKRPAREL